jgi:hypothetical protein
MKQRCAKDVLILACGEILYPHFYIIAVRLSPAACPSTYLYSNFTLQTMQFTVQNNLLDDRMDELLDTVYSCFQMSNTTCGYRFVTFAECKNDISIVLTIKNDSDSHIINIWK